MSWQPAPLQIVMLTDAQLDAEISVARDTACCGTLLDASRAFCGCGGRAADYLRRLRAEAVRRDDEQAAS